jgi:hypothetical protein
MQIIHLATLFENRAKNTRSQRRLIFKHKSHHEERHHGRRRSVPASGFVQRQFPVSGRWQLLAARFPGGSLARSTILLISSGVE